MINIDGFERKSVELDQGRIDYREAGSGAPIVFVHGLLVNGLLWKGSAERLKKDFQCIVPDWPLGSHQHPMRPDADLSPPGLARLVSDFLAAVDLDGVTLVGNDSGGAVSQIVAARHPERLGRLVLTNCDSHDNFPPGAFKPVIWAARARLLTAFVQPLRFHWGRRLPIAYGMLTSDPVQPEIERSWVEPFFSDAGVRRDARKVAAGFDDKHTLDAAKRLESFDRPALLAWGTGDRFFKLTYAERLEQAMPDARLERIEGARAFVPIDQPERLAELIAGFAREPAAARA